MKLSILLANTFKELLPGTIFWIVIIALIIIYRRNKKNKKLSPTNGVPMKSGSRIPTSLLSQFNDKGKKWMLHLEKLYDSGLGFDGYATDDYQKMFNVKLPKQNLNSMFVDMGLNPNYEDAPEYTPLHKAGKLLWEMEFNIGFRNQVRDHVIDDKGESRYLNEVEKHNPLILWDDEILLEKIYNANLYIEINVKPLNTYQGKSYTKGQEIDFNTGVLPRVKSIINNFKLLSEGHMFVTNKRIVFKGFKQDGLKLSILADNEMWIDKTDSFNVLRDGILMNEKSDPKWLFTYPAYEGSIVERDEHNQMIRIFDRIIKNNYMENLVPFATSETA